MNALRNIGFFILLASSLEAFPQSPSSLSFWNQRSLSGEVSLKGNWRQQKSYYPESYENWRSLYGIFGLKLLSRSYLWLPSVMTLDLDLEFNPQTRKETYINIPDRNEVRTLNKVGVRSTILSDKPITLIPFYSFYQSFFNRENLTNIRSKTQQWGGTMLVKNKYFPLNLSYNDLKWNQKETETGRVFKNRRKTAEGRSSWHFSDRDKHELIFGHDDFTYTYTDVDTVRNVVNRVTMNNHFFLDSAKHLGFGSFINYFDQRGTYTFKRFEAYERFNFRLPHNFRLNTQYNYYWRKDRQTLKQNRLGVALTHKLFLSLRSSVFGEYVNTNQTLYRENNFRFGIGFDYTKKIGFGRLNLSYHYYRRSLKVNSSPSAIKITNEEHTLTDGVPVLLDKPYVDQNSVVVRDITGTIVYQLNFDYILIEHNNYVEIQRIIGGQIPNGGTVIVDYTAVQPGDYNYDLNNNRVYAGFMIFDRLLEVYYRWSLQDYANVMQTDFLTLKHYRENAVGIRVDKAFVRGGVEYNIFQSNIIPYRMMRYYLNLQKNYKNKLLLNLNGSLRDYRYIADGGEQILGNISGKASYTFKAQTKLELELGYLRHKAYLTDLHLWTGRLEFYTVFRQLYLNAGFDFYRRNYWVDHTRFVFNGVFLKVTRKF